jgi:hypothetical protein
MAWTSADWMKIVTVTAESNRLQNESHFGVEPATEF